jgi:glycosyltransferase involved in cell wall biosynthesis
VKIAVVSPVWFPVPPTGYGGIEAVVSLLTDGLVEAGHDVTLFATGDSRTPAQLEYAYEVAPSERFETVVPELNHALNCYARASDFDVVNDHSGPLSAAFLAMSSTPVVHTVHLPLEEDRAAVYDRLASVAPNLGLVSISMSQRKPRPALNWVGHCPNAVDLDVHRFNPDPGEYLLFLGRMSHDKGAHRAVAAAEQAGLPLKLAGKQRTAGERHYFATEVEPHLGDGIEYLGEVSPEEKVELLRDALVTLFPISWEEPFGLVMIESLACGTPVVASRCGAVPEVLEDGVTGIVVDVDAELSPAAIHAAAGLDRHACRAAAEERFAPAEMVARYARVFEAVAGGA